MAIVVSDTSPIRALSHLHCLPWLQDLFQNVIVPPGVAQELQNASPLLPVVHLSAWSFITVQPPRRGERVTELATTLDFAEAEAIALAEQIGAGFTSGHKPSCLARRRMPNVPMTVRPQLVATVRPASSSIRIASLLDRLQQEINFFISPALRHAVLQLARELSPPSK
ncbi:MAG TPA: hypothetical protein VGI40_10935 [Pirellulaceae bacterium]